MSGDDIRAGDVVVCVDASAGVDGTVLLKAARYYRVTRIGKGALSGELIVALAEYDCSVSGFYASRFRKLAAAEPCFTYAMRNLLPEPAGG